MRKILNLLMVLSLFNCTNKNGQKNTIINTAENTIEIHIDTVRIPINEDYFGYYTGMDIHNNYFYGYNKTLSSMDVFDLSREKTLKNIPIQKEGPNGVPQMGHFVVNDSLIIIDGITHFIALDFNGLIVQKIKKRDLNVENTCPGYTIDRIRPVTLGNFIHLCYSNRSNELIVPLYSESIQDQKLKYAGYCAVAVNLDTKNVEQLPIPYPKLFKHKKYYGNLDEIQLTPKGDSIVYNFPNSSEIHVYDRKTKQITDYQVNSSYTPNISETLDFQADRPQIMSHCLKSTFFHRIVYDPYRNLFFRLHAKKCESDRVFDDRNYYLTIMNDSFEKLTEIVLPSTIYPVYSVSRKGLLFQFLKHLDEDYFTCLLFRFDDRAEEEEKGNENEIVENIETKQVKKDLVQTEKKADFVPEASKTKNVEDKLMPFPLDKMITIELLISYIEQNLVYPEDALKNRVEGIVQMLIQYDSLGIVNDRRIIYSHENKEFEKEAWRLVNAITKVKTDKKGGFSFPVVFNIKRYEAERKVY